MILEPLDIPGTPDGYLFLSLSAPVASVAGLVLATLIWVAIVDASLTHLTDD